MHVRIDYYSKEEVMVDYNINNLYEEYSKNQRELLLLSVYLFRSYINLGTHPVGKLLSILLSHSDLIYGIGTYSCEFPSPRTLRAYSLMDGIQFHVEMEQLHSLILSTRPSIVEDRGKGKMRFYMTLSPTHFDLNGFGIFSVNQPYCSFHSIYALASKMISKNNQNVKFIFEVTQILTAISKDYQNSGFGIYTDSEGLSLRLLQHLGISS